MRKAVFFICALTACGCAKVNIATSKPLKVDINMRVDVYQHVAKDVESIEDQIYGSSKKQINAISFIESVYAQEGSPELNSAIQARRARAATIEDLFRKGYIGENKDAYVELRAKDGPAGIQTVVSEENKDRSVIYAATAQKNGADILSVQKAFFDDHYKRASAGSWFQVFDETKGAYEWKQK